MRREDILLREAARRGDPDACLRMAARLFGISQGVTPNFKLGLAYLQNELAGRSRVAALLVGNMVPLEVLMAQNARPALAAAAQAGSATAMLKLGIWQLLAAQEDGAAWLRESGLAAPGWDSADPGDPAALANLLRRLPPELLDAGQVALASAREALALGELGAARRCIAAASLLKAPAGPLSEAVASLVKLAASSGSPVALPVALVEASLARQSDTGDPEALYCLGCALAGMGYRGIPACALAGRTQPRRAAALLLRAADGGKAEGWMKLFEITSSHRSAAGNQDAARFFLEKAARAGILEAQRKFGAILLRDASSLGQGEAGVQWLSKAAQAGDGAAHALLQTLVLPLPVLHPGIENAIVEKVRAIDGELAIRMTLARAFHLTRREALNFNARRDIRPWGVLIPGTPQENPKGRLAPLVGEKMRAELQRVVNFFDVSRSLDIHFFLNKRRKQREVFQAFAIPESMFFPSDIGRSLTHYGFGRHWATHASKLLRAHVDAGPEPVVS